VLIRVNERSVLDSRGTMYNRLTLDCFVKGTPILNQETMRAVFYLGNRAIRGVGNSRILPVPPRPPLIAVGAGFTPPGSIAPTFCSGWAITRAAGRWRPDIPGMEFAGAGRRDRFEWRQ